MFFRSILLLCFLCSLCTCAYSLDCHVELVGPLTARLTFNTTQPEQYNILWFANNNPSVTYSHTEPAPVEVHDINIPLSGPNTEYTGFVKNLYFNIIYCTWKITPAS